MYKVIGYHGVNPEIIMETDSLKNAVTEYLSYEDDLLNNPCEMSAGERFDYIELYFKDTMLECCHVEEECDRCGYHDVGICESNGCVNEY